MGGVGARQLQQEVASRLRQLEASLSPPGGASQHAQQLSTYGLACVLPAYRQSAACAQMCRDLHAAQRVRHPGDAPGLGSCCSAAQWAALLATLPLLGACSRAPCLLTGVLLCPTCLYSCTRRACASSQQCGQAAWSTSLWPPSTRLMRGKPSEAEAGAVHTWLRRQCRHCLGAV